MASKSADADLVATSARDFDPDRYLAALLAPRSHRADLVTLAALTGEVSRTLRTVREPMLAEIRLQWWRDALAAGAVTGSPVADAAVAMVRRHRIGAGLLDDLTFADAAATGPIGPDSDAWRRLGASDAAAFRIATAVLCISRSHAADRTLTLAGEAFAVARRLHVEASGHSPPGGARLSLPLAPWIEGVRSRRDQVRLALADAPFELLVALLPLALIEPYLRALQENEGGGTSVRGSLSPLLRAWSLWRARLRRRI